MLSANAMGTLDDLVFSEATEQTGSHVATQPLGLRSTDALFDALTRELKLPWYFGRNWDALDEVLRDFSWIPERRVTLVHLDVPGIPAVDLRTYLDVLVSARRHWMRDSAHEFAPLFAPRLLEAIRAAI
jgi:RNAse (barnase) inhibitor barstar